MSLLKPATKFMLTCFTLGSKKISYMKTTENVRKANHDKTTPASSYNNSTTYVKHGSKMLECIKVDISLDRVWQILKSCSHHVRQEGHQF